VEEDLEWHIGQEATGNNSLKDAPLQALFLWKENNQLRFQTFTKSELGEEIKNRRTLGLDTTQFELALNRLIKQQR